MSASTKTTPQAATPVMLCRLCHCEFTNFKEHVKSLVHLDARETKLTPQPPAKHKSSEQDNENCAKKVKTNIDNGKSIASSTSKNDGGSDATKESSSSDKADTPISTEKAEESSLSEEDDGNELKETVNSSADDKSEPSKSKEGIEISEYAKRMGHDLTLKEKKFLDNVWHCKMCLHVHRIEDGSFDEHVHDEVHKESLARRLEELKRNYEWRSGNQWLLSCSACALRTNDKDEFISHLQTELHDTNVKRIIGNNRVALSADKPWHQMDRKERRRLIKLNKFVNAALGPQKDAVPPKNTTPSKNTAPPKNAVPQKNANNLPATREAPAQGNRPKQDSSSSKPLTSQTQINKSTPGKPHQERFQGNSTVPQNANKKNQTKSNPKPLMSLSLSRNKPVWSSSPSLKQPSSNNPGIHGDYRSDTSNTSLKNFGYDRSAHRQDALSHSTFGSSSGSGGRPTYSEVNRDPQFRSFELDSARSGYGTDSVWSRQSSIAAPTEKLNPVAFTRVEQESPSRQFDVLANLLSQQRSSMLPSSVSLDLASNSSIRFKYGSERGEMFDNYPTSRPDLSRSDLPRTDFFRQDVPRMNVSSQDLFSRSMYTRR